MTAHVIKPLTPETFPAWLALTQKHNGVWGECYRSYFHEDTEHTVTSEYGSPVELPRISHRKEYDAGQTQPAPSRITCFFVDRDHRRSGVARKALDGALELIARAGGGEVVSFPNELAPGKRTSSSFLRNGTRAMFEKAGFTFERHIGATRPVEGFPCGTGSVENQGRHRRDRTSWR